MELSPQDLGHLARLLPFAIAVLAWLWKRAKSPGSTPAASRSKMSTPLPPDPARFSGPGPIEPR